MSYKIMHSFVSFLSSTSTILPNKLHPEQTTPEDSATKVYCEVCQIDAQLAKTTIYKYTQQHVSRIIQSHQEAFLRSF